MLLHTDRLLLSTDIYDYHYVSNGKTTVDSIDDDEEMKMTDVSSPKTVNATVERVFLEV